MPDLHLHIVSFTVPWPPNYGGVIDVFYKIRALYEAGIKIHLHCFRYDRAPAKELEKYCYGVNYYPRKTGVASAVSWMPYIVYSRRSEQLIGNLLQDDHPILFEGLHSCYYLSHPKLKDRIRIYRESNIEHQYYYHLSKAEPDFIRKIYFLFSSFKLRAYQGILSHASLMLTVSKEDTVYLKEKFKGIPVEYLPSFHKNDRVNILPGTGEYALYQGNLSVPENARAAEYLINKIFADSDVPFILAGMNPGQRLKDIVRLHPNVKLIANPDDETLNSLIREAQINIMVTFQPTGLKLKLLNALFNGRFCLVNPGMIAGTELAGLCITADSAEEMKNRIGELMDRNFDENAILERKEKLMIWHSNTTNCKRLLELLSLRNSR